ncbi:MAG: DoxX family protein, partial [Chitinophagaceae bacterium]|nr:DoxX family protein [Chitinophagaceae bacterium]
MKATINIIRVIVGVLFIFSGLVKANDPHGLSYKMQEFFEIWQLGQFND